MTATGHGPCVFPFRIGDIVYDGCVTREGQTGRHCPYKMDLDGNPKVWGECRDDCPVGVSGGGECWVNAPTRIRKEGNK